MSAVAAQLLDMAGGWAWLGWVVFLRVAAAMALLPAFGSQSVPLRVRLALACAFAAVVAPAVADRVVCEAFGAQPGASGWHLVWEDPGD